MGYWEVGFDVIGVDKDPHPNYPFTFVQGDALELIPDLCRRYRPAALGGSPPCQTFANVTAWRGDQAAHPNLIPETRRLFQASGVPWVIENVPEAAAAGELRPDYLLCGSMFGLRVRRHRVFETSWRAFSLRPPCTHADDDLPFEHKNERAFADAMGCTWMSAHNARQAIPPAYTRHIGEDLMNHLIASAA